MAIIEITVLQKLEFVDFISTNQKIINIVDRLTFVQTGDDHEPQEQIQDDLNFVQAANTTISGTRSISETLHLTDKAYHNQAGSAYQNLSFVQTVYGGAGQWPLVSQELDFTENVNVVATKLTFHILTFQEKIRLNRVFSNPVSQTLVFNQHAVIYKEDVKWVSPVAVIPTVPSLATTVTLVGVGTIVLPAPDFSNNEDYGQTRISRQTRGGELIVFRDPVWPDENDLSMKFSYLTQSQVRLLEAFSYANLGLPITITDFEGNAHTVVITNPEILITQAGRSNYTAELKVMKVNA